MPYASKGQNSKQQFVVKKVSLIEKVSAEKMEDLMVLEIHLAPWTRLRAFTGLGGTHF